MEQEIIQLCLQYGSTFALAIITIYWLITKRRKKNEDNNDIKTQLLLVNQKLDNHIQHFGEEITTIKEDIREIKSDILDLKIKK